MDPDDIYDKAHEAYEAENFDEAFRLFKISAESGNSDALNTVAYFLDHGIAVKVDKITAMRFYKKAAQKNNICAISNIGLTYRDNGDLRRAIYWLKKAIKLGDGDSALELAKIFMKRSSRSRMQTRQLLEKAVNSESITEASKEEAINILNNF